MKTFKPLHEGKISPRFRSVLDKFDKDTVAAVEAVVAGSRRILGASMGVSMIGSASIGRGPFKWVDYGGDIINITEGNADRNIMFSIDKVTDIDLNDGNKLDIRVGAVVINLYLS